MVNVHKPHRGTPSPALVPGPPPGVTPTTAPAPPVGTSTVQRAGVPAASYGKVDGTPREEQRPGTTLKGGTRMSLMGARMAAVESARTGQGTHVSAARPTAVGVKEIEDPSLPSAFLKVKRYELTIHRPGVKEPQSVEITALRGPREQDGCSMVATLVMDPRSGAPCAVFKLGDTRLAPTLRGDPYVGAGMTGGRWDYEGVSAEKIGVSEIAEELGGGVSAFFPVSKTCVPTMPHEAMEVDAYYAAVIKLGGDIHGDGGGMEVPTLMRPGVMPMDQALQAMDNGLIREGARARVAYARALDAMGYIPQLGMYVRDLPPALQKRWSDLGVTEKGSQRPFIAPLPDAQASAPTTVGTDALRTLNPGNKHRIQRDASSEKTTALPALDGTFISTQTQHITSDGSLPASKPVPNQVLSLGHDRAKGVLFHEDPQRGLLVKMDWVERPLMAAKGLARKPGVPYPEENMDLSRLDTADLKVKVTDKDGRALGAEESRKAVRASVEAWAAQQQASDLVELGQPTYASPGQTQMKYHFYAARADASAVKRDAGFVPLSEAIRRCRAEGHGDVATEALLLRLAANHDVIPGLAMTATEARAAMGSART